MPNAKAILPCGAMVRRFGGIKPSSSSLSDDGHDSHIYQIGTMQYHNIKTFGMFNNTICERQGEKRYTTYANFKFLLGPANPLESPVVSTHTMGLKAASGCDQTSDNYKKRP